MAYYEGLEYVDHPGRFQSKLSADTWKKVEKIISIILEHSETKDQSAATQSDLPSTIFTVEYQGKHRYLNYYGDIPEDLMSVVDSLEHLVAFQDWKPQ